MNNPFLIHQDEFSPTDRCVGAADLLHLALHLEAHVLAANFNLGHWSRFPRGSSVGHEDIITAQDVNMCGTTACALGHAATIPQFVKRGLALAVNTSPRQTVAVMGYVEYSNRYNSVYYGFNAAQQFFSLTMEESQYLFCSLYYPWNSQEPQMVAERIRSCAALMISKAVAE